MNRYPLTLSSSWLLMAAVVKQGCAIPLFKRMFPSLVGLPLIQKYQLLRLTQKIVRLPKRSGNGWPNFWTALMTSKAILSVQGSSALAFLGVLSAVVVSFSFSLESLSKPRRLEAASYNWRRFKSLGCISRNLKHNTCYWVHFPHAPVFPWISNKPLAGADRPQLPSDRCHLFVVSFFFRHSPFGCFLK